MRDIIPQNSPANFSLAIDNSLQINLSIPSRTLLFSTTTLSTTNLFVWLVTGG
jgi:hypothetical protein